MSDNSSSSGISTVGLLGVVFVVLKLLKMINWSWWWVTLPFWGGIALLIIGVIIYFSFKLIFGTKSRGRNIDNRINTKFKL